MRILVTGGAGFIGSHLVDAFLAAGHEVAIIDAFTTGKRENVNPKAALFELDIADHAAVKKAFAEFKPEIVSHHAAQVSVVHSVDDPVEDARFNVLGTTHILQEAVNVGARKVIFSASGGTLYGTPDVLPCTEDMTPNPQSPYAVSKFAAEQYIWLYTRLTPLKATVLRYGNVYGPRQDPHGEAGVCAIFAGRMLKGEAPKIFGDGSQRRDYVFVEDVVAANLAALEKGDGRSYNIGTGRGTSTQEVFDAVAAATGFTQPPVMAPARAGEVQAIFLDPTRAKNELDWEPKVSFMDGAAKTAEWFKAKLAAE